ARAATLLSVALCVVARLPCSALFPYTTLFRSLARLRWIRRMGRDRRRRAGRAHALTDRGRRARSEVPVARIGGRHVARAGRAERDTAAPRPHARAAALGPIADRSVAHTSALHPRFDHV